MKRYANKLMATDVELDRPVRIISPYEGDDFITPVGATLH